jgi:hypothetical protein
VNLGITNADLSRIPLNYLLISSLTMGPCLGVLIMIQPEPDDSAEKVSTI